MDSMQSFRDWGSALAQALGIPIVMDQNGTLALTTKGGNVFSITPVTGQIALTFAGILGRADDDMPASMLRTLLALNLNPGMAGAGCIAVVPHTREIVLRLDWRPAEKNWTEQIFAAVLAAFAEHVDELAAAIANRELGQMLDTAAPAEFSAARASSLTGLV